MLKKKFEPLNNKVWLSSPTMYIESLEYMKKAYETNWMSTVGENINEVEKLGAAKAGCKYGVALSSGTAALHMAMRLAGVKRDTLIFSSDVTFAATINPAMYEVQALYLLIPNMTHGIWIR